MSEVYPALDLANNCRKVAVKLFAKGRIEDDILKETYERGVRALKDLKASPRSLSFSIMEPTVTPAAFSSSWNNFE
jgi:hypothetical protein